MLYCCNKPDPRATLSWSHFLVLTRVVCFMWLFTPKEYDANTSRANYKYNTAKINARVVQCVHRRRT